MKKTVVAGIFAGLILFGWSTIAHMPPLGTAGYGTVPVGQGDIVLATLRGAMSERAIYLVPGLDLTRPLTPEEQQAWTSKYEAGPAAVVIYNPRPADRAVTGSLFSTWFAVEFLMDMLSGLLAAVIAGGFSSALGYWPRVFLLSAVGLVSTIDVDASYWNWYGFPTSYFLAQLADHVGGWFLAGLVLARVTRRT